VQLSEINGRLWSENEDEVRKDLDALSLIDDERAIPIYVQMIATRSEMLKSRALDRLSHFNSDAALSGIRAAMQTQAADIDIEAAFAVQAAAGVRRGAATALARSPHPDAFKLLRTMAGDPDIAIRTDIVRALAQDGTPESRQVLETMTRDAEPRVRDEAIQLLKGFQ
jgi:HEAT repeat protein